MIETPVLTDGQVADFDRDSFVAVPGAFSAADTAVIERWTREVTALPEVSGRHWVFHAGYKDLAEVLKGPAAQVFGEDVVLFKEKINFKGPGGEGFEPHQDSQAGWEVYASNFVNVMVCIDSATLENGCIEVAAGHHRRGLLRGMEPLKPEDMEGMEFKPCPTQPGDIVLFDAYAPHRSAPNMTRTTRRLYFATYNRASEGDHLVRYYADKRRNFPPDVERDPDKKYIYKV
jgi:hypothetical protein